MKKSGCFFITSYGRTATLWLTRALDIHPDIICTHGPSLHRFDGEEDFVQVQKTSALFYGMSLKEIVTSISANSKSDKKWVGNVHAYTALNLSTKQKVEPDAPPLHTVNLLRHPVTRIDSFWRRFQFEHTVGSPTAKWINDGPMKQLRYQEVLEELQRHHDVAIASFDERAFFHAVMQTSTDAGDLEINVPQIISERLVADIDYFCYVFDLLTGGDISISKDYLARVFALGKINEAKGGGRSAIQVFDEWLPWQRTLFLMFLRDHPMLQTGYPALGYHLPDLSTI